MEVERREILRRMSPEQKLRAAQRLRESAWAVKVAWVRRQHAEWSEDRVEGLVREAFRDGGR
ncbi:MAG: hypothetical protein AAGC74_11770 [Verrucomicrobiota bacterium]